MTSCCVWTNRNGVGVCHDRTLCKQKTSVKRETPAMLTTLFFHRQTTNTIADNDICRCPISTLIGLHPKTASSSVILIGQFTASTGPERLTRYSWLSTFLLNPLLRSWPAIWGAERQGGWRLSATRQKRDNLRVNLRVMRQDA